MKFPLFFLIIILSLQNIAWSAEYDLVIEQKEINIDGKTTTKIAVNGQIPGSVLKFKEGEEVTINVTNKLNENSAIHWHGLLLPGYMDGVPGLNGFNGIKPNETFKYNFKIRQSGTYWYHAHWGAQEQDGLYGAIIIDPKIPEKIKYDKDYAIVLSDFSFEKPNQIINNLKSDSGYYNNGKLTLGDFFKDAKVNGWQNAWQNTKDWGSMRMSPTDLSDVSGYKFLINGKTVEDNWTGLFKMGEKIRLRFINASAMSFFDVRIPELKMLVIAADGNNIEPVTIDEFRIGNAETYDIIVQPKEDKPYSIVAEPIDRSGFAIGTLATKFGQKGQIPPHRKRSLLTMADMGMEHGNMQHDMTNHHMHHNMNTKNNNEPDKHKNMPDMTNLDMGNMHHGTENDSSKMINSGWADASTPQGSKQLDYKDLRHISKNNSTNNIEREIIIKLGGNMERYIWTLNGKTYDKAEAINLKYGEIVRLKFINETMMAHTMHLHGMFVSLENGQKPDKMPLKHTVIVPPGKTISVLLNANEPGEWAFHCHLLYHMLSGMMSKIVVSNPPDKKELRHAH